MADVRQVLRNFGTSAIFFCAALTGISSSAGTITTHVMSNGDWRSSASGPLGWQAANFDDSGWSFARAPYPYSSPGIPGSSAQSIWHDPTGASNGENGVTTAFFRYTFDLMGGVPTLGQVSMIVDDDYAFYVNGSLALLNNDQGYAGLMQVIDITGLLQSGKNVFAIQAVDGGWGGPYNRGSERVIFDATIQAMPEPSSWLLVGLALGGLAMSRRQTCAETHRFV